MERILMLVADAAEELEVDSILYRLREAGYAVASEIEQAGRTFEDAPCVIDRNMVSSRGWGDLAEFGEGFLGVRSGVAAR